MTIDDVKEWLEAQLETATPEGGNELTPGTHVSDIDPAWGDDEVMATVGNYDVVFRIKVMES